MPGAWQANGPAVQSFVVTATVVPPVNTGAVIVAHPVEVGTCTDPIVGIKAEK